MPGVVIVEDDPDIRRALVQALTDRGYATRSSGTGLDGLSMVVDEPPDIVVLDLGLPDIEGLDLLRMVRSVRQTPIVVATARDDEDEIIRTLDAGADDYIVKPFSADQLDARIRAVLRRSSDAASEAVAVGELHLDPTTRIATVHGDDLELTRKEFDLLHYLAERAGRVVTKRQLLADVWNQPHGGSDKTVDVHLSWLRRKLGESANQPRFLRTVRGVGVKLVDPDQQ